MADGLETVLCPGCLHDGVLERTLERAEAAEAKLAAIEVLCRDPGSHVGHVMASKQIIPGDRVAASILAIIGEPEERSDEKGGDRG